MFFDWPQFQASNTQTPAVVDPRRRLAICLAGFVAISFVVFARAVQLEVTQGEAFRSVALRPIEKKTVLPAARGRILARDGTVLARDETVRAVAVEYRRLQEPPDAHWLRTMVRSRLSKTDRKNAEIFAEEQAKVLAERTELAGRLSKLCGLSPQQWAARTRRIQTQVERIADDVNRRRQSERDCPDFRGRQSAAMIGENGTVPLVVRQDSWTVRLRRLLLEDPPPPRIVVAEELASHVVAEDVPETVVSEIENHADRYPGTRIVEVVRRTYPQGALAAHVLGHLGPAEAKDLEELRKNLPSPFGRGAGGKGRDGEDPNGPHPNPLPKGEGTYITNPLPKGEGTDAPGVTTVGMAVELPSQQVGKMGVEREYEIQLEGRSGVAVEQTDRSGRLVASSRPKEPIAGRDLTLTLDASLQRTAEDLLHSALQRNDKRGRESFSGALSAKKTPDPFISEEPSP